MAKTTFKDLTRLAKLYHMPLALMVLCFKDMRKSYTNDVDALEGLIDTLAEGAIS